MEPPDADLRRPEGKEEPKVLDHGVEIIRLSDRQGAGFRNASLKRLDRC
jgi:hypothetical protein